MTRSCDYASCPSLATAQAGPWAFCAQHAQDHKTDAVGAHAHALARYDQAAAKRLLVGSSTPEVSTRITELPVRTLAAHPENVRSDLGDLTDIIASVRAQGVLQPLLVTRGPRGAYVVIAGHRRLAAALAVGLPRLPVVLRERLVGTDAIEAMLVENLQRADLNPMDEAEAFAKLVAAGRTQRQIAAAVGKPEPYISMRLALTYLTAGEKAAVRRGDVKATDGYRIGRARNPRALAVAKKEKPRRVPHFTAQHPLAARAEMLCKLYEHPVTLRLGVACGPCWEHTIRDDAAAADFGATG